jgi:predicted PurR-regulated permease PerM
MVKGYLAKSGYVVTCGLFVIRAENSAGDFEFFISQIQKINPEVLILREQMGLLQGEVESMRAIVNSNQAKWAGVLTAFFETINSNKTWTFAVILLFMAFFLVIFGFLDGSDFLSSFNPSN